MDYLVMRLYAPLSSWGTMATGGDRSTNDYPTRGAILGLIGAALGIRRDDQEQQQALASSIGMASKTYSRGTILRDFHTIQTASTTKGQRLHTRRQELQSENLETVLSSRDYREDGLWVIAIWLKQDAGKAQDHGFDLPVIKHALTHPKFTLYLGRKSCPLAMPLVPNIVAAESLKQALDTPLDSLLPVNQGGHNYRVNELLYRTVSDRYLPTETTMLRDESSDESVSATRHRQVVYHWEGSRDDFFGTTPTEDADRVFTHKHWDEPIDRKQWQFTQRIGHEWTALEPLVPLADSMKSTNITTDELI